MNQHESFVLVLKKKDLQELVLIRFRTDSPETCFFRSTRSSRSVASLTLPQWGIKELLMVVEAASLTSGIWVWSVCGCCRGGQPSLKQHGSKLLFHDNFRLTCSVDLHAHTDAPPTTSIRQHPTSSANIRRHPTTLFHNPSITGICLA